MSGIEVAGLVLGAIPLILAGLELYSNGISITKRYWRYREEFKSLVVELRCEHTMCVNSINMLLIGVMPAKEMAEFLVDPCNNDKWKGKKFDKRLRERLGPSYGSYMDTMAQINNTTNIFQQRLKLDSSGKPQFEDPKAFKEHYKRLKFSLDKKDYSDLMNKLRQSNSSLHRMTTQTISIQNLQSSTKPERKSIPNFNAINEKAQGFYSALCSGWKCPCHADHSVSLRLEPRMGDVSSDDDDDNEESMKDPFHILFRYSHQHYAKRSSSSSASTSPWTWEECTADVRIALPSESPTAIAPARSCEMKGVRFESQAKNAVKAALSPIPNLLPIRDLWQVSPALSGLPCKASKICFAQVRDMSSIYSFHIKQTNFVPSWLQFCHIHPTKA